MKTSTANIFLFISTEAFHCRHADWLDKFRRMSKAKKRAVLVSIGALNADGSLPVFPMDHVPLGPRE